MDRLPVEVANMILDELSLANLKAMRLSCRRFAELAADYIFECVWLYLDEDSFARMTALSEHPTLRLKVNTVKIFSNLLSADLLLRRDYENCVKNLTFTGEGREAWGFDVDGKRTLSQAQLDAGFAEYHNLYNSQLDFRCKAEDLLQAAFSAFTNLIWITNGFLDEIFVNNNKLPYQQSKVTDIASKTLLARDCAGWNGDANDAEDALMLIRAIAMSECVIDTLDLGTAVCSYDCLFLELSPRDRVFAKQALREIARLNINLYSKNDEKFEQVLDAGHLSRFLSWCSVLDTLEVTNVGNGFVVSLHHLFGTVYWKGLRTLSLSDFDLTFVNLTTLIEKFGETLQTLRIDGITLYTGSWYRIFLAVKDMQMKGALKKFHPQELRIANSEECFFEWTCDEKLLEKLSSFIFEEGVWPSESPAGLMQEAGTT